MSRRIQASVFARSIRVPSTSPTRPYRSRDTVALGTTRPRTRTDADSGATQPLDVSASRPRSRSSYLRGGDFLIPSDKRNNVITETCLIEECDAPRASRGLCPSCYQKIRRQGRLAEYPATASTARHSLSDVDVDARTATCSVCGPTRVRIRKTRKTHECMTVRRRTKTNPIQSRRSWLKRKYGLTPEKYDDILLSQNSACAICHTKDSGSRAWHVDHDHSCCPGRNSCGKCVRGLLCNLCNTGLGYFRDNPKSMERAIAYLAR